VEVVFVVLGILGVLSMAVWLDQRAQRVRAYRRLLQDRKPVSDEQMLAGYFRGESMPLQIPGEIRRKFAGLLRVPAERLLPDDYLTPLLANETAQRLRGWLDIRFGISIAPADYEKTQLTVQDISRLVICSGATGKLYVTPAITRFSLRTALVLFTLVGIAMMLMRGPFREWFPLPRPPPTVEISTNRTDVDIYHEGRVFRNQAAQFPAKMFFTKDFQSFENTIVWPDFTTDRKTNSLIVKFRHGEEQTFQFSQRNGQTELWMWGIGNNFDEANNVYRIRVQFQVEGRPAP